MRLLVTDTAAQSPRQSTAWLIMTLGRKDMKARTQSILTILGLGLCYLIGFRHGRFSRPIEFIEPPMDMFQSADDAAINGFLFQRYPIYLTWDASANSFAAYSESPGILDQVRVSYRLRYSPVTGQPLFRAMESSELKGKTLEELGAVLLEAKDANRKLQKENEY